uniref:Uncharacterized protein n=1 Tax=Clytia hemisphaerica TaxID=252671 RepID=A0A7M5WW43_9CNID
MIMDNNDYYFRSLSIRKIVLKFLTKVDTLEVAHHEDLRSIKDFVETEYSIPKHLQIYMLYNVTINSKETLTSTILNYYSNDDDKGILILNLIAKPPDTLHVSFSCPYYNLKDLNIGLPEMLKMVETSTIADVERKMAPYDVHVSLSPTLPSYDKLSDMKKENCHLFRIARDCGNSNTVELYVYRRIKVRLHSCKTCRLDVKERVFIIDSITKTIKDFIKDEFVHQTKLCCQEVDLRLFPDSPKDITVRSHLIDFPLNVDLNLQAVRSQWRFFRFLKFKN